MEIAKVNLPVGLLIWFGFEPGAAPATVVGLQIEVPAMLLVVKIVNDSKGWYEVGQKESMSSNITIYHNPACGTSRETLVAPVALIAAMGVSVRGLLRQKGTPYDDLKLDDPRWTDAQSAHWRSRPMRKKGWSSCWRPRMNSTASSCNSNNNPVFVRHSGAPAPRSEVAAEALARHRPRSRTCDLARPNRARQCDPAARGRGL